MQTPGTASAKQRRETLERFRTGETLIVSTMKFKLGWEYFAKKDLASAKLGFTPEFRSEVAVSLPDRTIFPAAHPQL